jgi:hypothetical protein
MSSVIVHIPAHEIEDVKGPREFYRLLEKRGVKLFPFVDMGPNQPLTDWLEHDLKWLLYRPWEIWFDPCFNEWLVRQ